MKEWHVTRTAFSPVLALGLAGMAVGSPIFGYWGDRDRPPFGADRLHCAVRDGNRRDRVRPLGNGSCGLRFVTGLGVGGAVPNAGTLAAEFAPLRRRPMAMKFTIVCIPLGGMLGGLIAARVLPLYGWRMLYLIGGIAPLVFAVVLCWLLPESPRFLAQRKAGWPALSQFLNRAGLPVAPDSVFEDRTERKAGGQAPIRALLSPLHRRDTAGLWIAFLFCLGGIYLVFGWLPTLLSSQGLSVGAASSGLALYNLGGVAGVLLWAVLMTLFGSRRPLVWGSLAAALSAAAVWFAPASLLLPSLAVNGLLANAVQTSMYALAAHVYPTAIRSSGVAWCATIGRVGGILSSLLGAAIIGAGAGVYWGVLAAAMVCASVGLAIVSRHVPATDRYA